MNNQTIEKGDIVALKDGREVEVLSVKKDGNELRRFDYVDRATESPMRKTEYPSAILRLLRKGNLRKVDPLAVLPHDNPIIPPLPVRIVEDTDPFGVEDKANSTPATSVKPVNKAVHKGKGK